MVTDLHMRPVMSFLCLGTKAGGVYMRTLGQGLGTPILQQGELPSCPGEGIYAAVQVDPPLASKTTRLDEKQLYFLVAHHTQVGVLRKNLSTEQGKIPYWD